MVLIRQAVPYRNAGVLCERLYDLLLKSSVLDAVIHTAQHTGGIRDAFLLSDLRSRRIQIGDLHAQIIRGDLKGAPGPRTGLFEDQRNVFSFVSAVRRTRLLQCLQLCRPVDHADDLLRGKILQCQKTTSLQVHFSIPLISLLCLLFTA